MQYPVALPPQKPYKWSYSFLSVASSPPKRRRTKLSIASSNKRNTTNDESLAGKSPKNLIGFESYACMDKKARAISSITAALLLIFSLLEWDGEEIM